MSRGCEGNEKGRNSGSILRWIRIGLGGGDLTCPGVQPGKGVYACGVPLSFVPRAYVSMFEFTTLSS